MRANVVGSGGLVTVAAVLCFLVACLFPVCFPRAAAAQPAPAQPSEPRDRTKSVDRVTFDDGRIVEGFILEENAETVRMQFFLDSLTGECVVRKHELAKVQRNVPPMEWPKRKTTKPPAGAPSPSERDDESNRDLLVEGEQPASEQSRLLAVLSDEYLLAGKRHSVSPNAGMIRPFMSSHDPNILEIAKRAMGIHVLYDLLNSRINFTPEAMELYREFIEFAVTAETDVPFRALRQAGEIFGASGGAVHAAAERLRGSVEVGVEIQRAQNAMRRRVRDWLVSEEVPETPAEVLGVRFVAGSKAGETLRTSSRGFLAIVNRSEKPLRRVAFVLDVEMNREKIDALWNEELQEWKTARLLEAAIGVNQALWESRVEARRLEMERLKLGYGSVVYVERLPARAELRIDLASLGDLDRIVGSVEMLAVEEGRGFAKVVLDVNEMLSVIERTVKAQQAKKK